MIVWDLDGTLINTRTANLNAYEHIGVRPPPDFDTRPWQEWCSERDHARKGDIIHKYLARYATPTPLLDWYYQVRGPILTNASEQVCRFLIDKYDLFEVNSAMTPEMKVEWLADRRPGLYLDDSKRTIDMVRRSTSWCAVQVRF